MSKPKTGYSPFACWNEQNTVPSAYKGLAYEAFAARSTNTLRFSAQQVCVHQASVCRSHCMLAPFCYTHSFRRRLQTLRDIPRPALTLARHFGSEWLGYVRDVLFLLVLGAYQLAPRLPTDKSDKVAHEGLSPSPHGRSIPICWPAFIIHYATRLRISHPRPPPTTQHVREQIAGEKQKKQKKKKEKTASNWSTKF